MYNFLIENNLLYKYQSGFLPHHATVFQLIDIFHYICQAFDINMFSCIVFCDVSKAFDRVWHKGLMFKLRQKDLSSLSTFKKHIISNFHISCVPPYYIMGNRYSSVNRAA